eukprot:gene28586-31752_t
MSRLGGRAGVPAKASAIIASLASAKVSLELSIRCRVLRSLKPPRTSATVHLILASKTRPSPDVCCSAPDPYGKPQTFPDVCCCAPDPYQEASNLPGRLLLDLPEPPRTSAAAHLIPVGKPQTFLAVCCGEYMIPTGKPRSSPNVCYYAPDLCQQAPSLPGGKPRTFPAICCGEYMIPTGKPRSSPNVCYYAPDLCQQAPSLPGGLLLRT